MHSSHRLIPLELPTMHSEIRTGGNEPNWVTDFTGQ